MSTQGRLVSAFIGGNRLKLLGRRARELYGVRALHCKWSSSAKRGCWLARALVCCFPCNFQLLENRKRQKGAKYLLYVQGGKRASTLLANYFTSLISASQPERREIALGKTSTPAAPPSSALKHTRCRRRRHHHHCRRSALLLLGNNNKKSRKIYQSERERETEADFYYFPPSTLLSAHSKAAFSLATRQRQMRNDSSNHCSTGYA
jgi:hypothetical protein